MLLLLLYNSKQYKYIYIQGSIGNLGSTGNVGFFTKKNFRNAGEIMIKVKVIFTKSFAAKTPLIGYY
jgi:hypothetical protein